MLSSPCHLALLSISLHPLSKLSIYGACGSGFPAPSISILRSLTDPGAVDALALHAARCAVCAGGAGSCQQRGGEELAHRVHWHACFRPPSHCVAGRFGRGSSGLASYYVTYVTYVRVHLHVLGYFYRRVSKRDLIISQACCMLQNFRIS